MCIKLLLRELECEMVQSFKDSGFCLEGLTKGLDQFLVV